MMKTTRALAMVGMAALLLASGARIAAEPSSTPRLDWLFTGGGSFNTGAVYATERIANTLYVSGNFTGVAPTATTPGYAFALSAATGAVVSPTIAANAPVYAIEPDGGGGSYLSQATSTASGSALATAIVHARADGSLDPSFSSAAITGGFGRLVRVGPSLIVAGGSTFGIPGSLKVGGVDRALVALDPGTGALLPWTPVVPYPASRVADVEAANGVLYVLFQPASLSAGREVSAYDGTTGVRLWTRSILNQPLGLPDSSGALAIAGNRLLVATSVGMFALNPSSGVIDPAWGGALAGESVLDMVVSGSTVFVGGNFTQFYGVPRTRVVALDVNTGALTTWNPALPNEGGQISLAASASGSVFLPSGGRVVEIDAAGVPTAWVSGATFLIPNVLETAPSGNLVVGTFDLATAGAASRVALAAFDATTGALLPAMPAFTFQPAGTPFPPIVAGMGTAGSTLYVSGLFTSVGGVARAGVAAIDTTTNTVLPWTPQSSAQHVVLVSAGHVYMAVANSGGSSQILLRRFEAVSGLQDAAWLPPPVTEVIERGGELVASRIDGSSTAVGALDATTGQFQQWFATALVRHDNSEVTPTSGRLAVDGDTVYLAGRRPEPGLERRVSDIVLAFHRYTGLQVGPAVLGYVNAVAVADGRLIPVGGPLVMTGSERLAVAEVARPGAFTGWTPGWPLRGAPLSFEPTIVGNFVKGALGVSVAGDLLVVRGLATGTATPTRVAAYPLSGASVPSNLRTQNVGPNTVFSWDAMVPPPTGGYVVEGGFAAGQTAAALPVGTATSVTLPLPPGPIFVRVRPSASTDVSNEIVAGCFAPPLPPTALTTSLTGTNLSLAWTPPTGAVTAYTFSGWHERGLEQRRHGGAARHADVDWRIGARRHVLRARHGHERVRHEWAERGSVLHDRRAGSVASGAHEPGSDRERVDGVAHVDGAGRSGHGLRARRRHGRGPRQHRHDSDWRGDVVRRFLERRPEPTHCACARSRAQAAARRRVTSWRWCRR